MFAVGHRPAGSVGLGQAPGRGNVALALTSAFGARAAAPRPLIEEQVAAGAVVGEARHRRRRKADGPQACECSRRAPCPSSW
eukprot:2234101-Heterocapsa_arctica.AAC.2